MIHVLRHPLDVVLSVFSNHLTHGFYCAYELETAARHYVLVMELVEHYRREMTLRYLPVRYEDIVDDQEASVRRMLDFIGEPFDARCLDFHENRRYARTASYAQVTEKLYDRSRYRYRHYLRHLEPVIPILRPVIERLGYTVDCRRMSEPARPHGAASRPAMSRLPLAAGPQAIAARLRAAPAGTSEAEAAAPAQAPALPRRASRCPASDRHRRVPEGGRRGAADHRAGDRRRPDAPLYLRNICAIYRALGRYDEAIAAGQRAVELGSVRSALPAQSRRRPLRRLELDEAIACARRAIALDPASPAPHFALAEALLLQGDFEAGWRNTSGASGSPSARAACAADRSAAMGRRAARRGAPAADRRSGLWRRHPVLPATSPGRRAAARRRARLQSRNAPAGRAQIIPACRCSNAGSVPAIRRLLPALGPAATARDAHRDDPGGDPLLCAPIRPGRPSGPAAASACCRAAIGASASSGRAGRPIQRRTARPRWPLRAARRDLPGSALVSLQKGRAQDAGRPAITAARRCSISAPRSRISPTRWRSSKPRSRRHRRYVGRAISPARWASRCGSCCPIRRTGAGCSTATDSPWYPTAAPVSPAGARSMGPGGGPHCGYARRGPGEVRDVVRDGGVGLAPVARPDYSRAIR